MFKKKKIYSIYWSHFGLNQTLIPAKTPKEAVKKFYKLRPWVNKVIHIAECKVEEIKQ